MIQLQECFPIPLWTDELTNIDNEKIKSFAINMRDSSPARRDANKYRPDPTGLKWRSFYLTQEELSTCGDLKVIISETISRVTDCFKVFGPNKGLGIRFDNCWFNLNDYGTYTGPHVHPASSMIATYYVSAPEKCGNIVFMNPNESIYWNFPAGAYSERTKYTDGLISVPVKEGKLVIAPAHFQHYVEPSGSEDLRISFTMNFVMYNATTLRPNDRNYLR